MLTEKTKTNQHNAGDKQLALDTWRNTLRFCAVYKPVAFTICGLNLKGNTAVSTSICQILKKLHH